MAPLLYPFASLSLLQLSIVSAISQHPIVVVIGFDGFRPDYLNRGLTPTLSKFVEDGVSTDYLQNVFPTKTMTNFFSIATGMYAETHGVLGNTVFNEKLECIGYSYELFHNANVTPIWTLNEMTGEGRRSGVMMWSGGEFEFQKVLPSYYQAYNMSISWHERVNRTLKWLLDEKKPINLLHMYFEQPDSAGHYYGIEAPEFNEQLKRVDSILSYFLRQLAAHGLEDKVNIIILSDHGMVDIDREHLINVTRSISFTGGKRCGSSPVLQVTTKSQERAKLYEQLVKMQKSLKTFNIYKRHEIPDHWHFKNNSRNTEFLLVGKIPSAFDEDKNKGEHGYDNNNDKMHAFFAAKGPLFRKNFHRRSLNNIDIYALISYMLSLDSSHLILQPNGTLSEIVTILNSAPSIDYKNPAKRQVMSYFIPMTPVLTEIEPVF